MMLKNGFRMLFAIVVIWPLAWLWLGLRVKHRERLPEKGPAIVVANHNSHMDVFALLALFSLRTQRQVHPVAAADYFLRNKALAWFTLNVLNIIPVARRGQGKNPLAACEQALRDEQILILFPEGTRGQPGVITPIKSGLWYLSQSLPQVAIIPIGLKGTERVMAKGNRIPLPLFIDVNIGEPLYFHPDKQQFKDQIGRQLLLLSASFNGEEPHG